ncbi:hypothetical protein [Bacillus sp. UNCCL81]|uniref:hypothetical protein n=1 Tax=Bacillus sp. UNCCL81 TaxID=1502755 RepID=UPI0008EBAD77|nr:hypothetical protein [Bacillus sp. UNCCL81]SFD52135.1 hypothetical protein SAMN02799633_04063 [Bacillus sp. UNCCL81]
MMNSDEKLEIITEVVNQINSFITNDNFSTYPKMEILELIQNENEYRVPIGKSITFNKNDNKLHFDSEDGDVNYLEELKAEDITSLEEKLKSISNYINYY